jgi:hypothetical protein
MGEPKPPLAPELGLVPDPPKLEPDPPKPEPDPPKPEFEPPNPELDPPNPELVPGPELPGVALLPFVPVALLPFTPVPEPLPPPSRLADCDSS